MASTNKTANLSLNQWVKSDPVLMEDMNEDNRKLDAALNRIKFFDITLKNPVPNLELDFTSIDLSNYLELQIYLDLKDKFYNSGVRVNGYTGSYAYIHVNGSTAKNGITVKPGKNVLDLTPPNMSMFGLHEFSIYTLEYSKIGNKINTLTLYDYNTTPERFPIGSNIKVYGVKK